MVLSLVTSLMVFICCNCGKCYKTRIIRGRVLMAPPAISITPQDQVTYIVVSSTSSAHPEPVQMQDYSSFPNSSFPNSSFPNFYLPPPSYEESQRHYKWLKIIFILNLNSFVINENLKFILIAFKLYSILTKFNSKYYFITFFFIHLFKTNSKENLSYNQLEVDFLHF